MVAIRWLLTRGTILAAGTAAALFMMAMPAGASDHWHAYAWARAHQGAWYCYGGTGPCFDCSGLVYKAYGRGAHIWLPRTTYGMLGSWRLKRVTHANSRMGDLAFYGSGHVELVAGRHYTFGAQRAGTRVNWHHWSYRSWYHPTAFYRVVRR